MFYKKTCSFIIGVLEIPLVKDLCSYLDELKLIQEYGATDIFQSHF